MLATLIPLLTENVLHWIAPTHNAFGKPVQTGATSHRARVTYSPRRTKSRETQELLPESSATLWLLNHPRPVLLGDTFELSDGTTRQVTQLEKRTIGADTLIRAQLT